MVSKIYQFMQEGFLFVILFLKVLKTFIRKNTSLLFLKASFFCLILFSLIKQTDCFINGCLPSSSYFNIYS